MSGIFNFFANLFGYVLNFIYTLVNNYGLAIIIFTILLKLLMLPMGIKQQKVMKKSARVQNKAKELQSLYSSDIKRMTEEVNKLYKEEGISQTSGCFSSIIQIIVILSIFFLVSRPLTYMKKVDSEVIEEYKNKLNISTQVENTEEKENVGETADTTAETTSQESTEKNNTTRYIEIAIIKQFSKEDERLYINMDFLGVDLSDIPTENFNNPKVYIIPILYIITSIASMKMNTNMSKKAVEEKNRRNEEDGKEKDDKTQEDMMLEMNENMMWIMPVMTVSIALIAPLGLALYWFISNLLMMGERIILNKFVKNEE